MKEFFKELFEYSHHSNKKLEEVFNDKTVQVSEKSIKLYNHILNAHQIWNNRIDSKETALGVWEIHSFEDLKVVENQNYEHSLSILNNYSLNGEVNYSNSKGQTFNNSIQDILFHIINHSTYHRGQIASEFKKYEINPLITDYIFFKR